MSRAHTPPVLEPADAHNAELVNQTHPPDWANPEPAERYNLVVVGAGTAGLVTAGAAATLGARVALVERHLMGGDCLVAGCVPSKALIRAARAADEVRRANRFGVHAPGGFSVDFAEVMARVRRVRAEIAPHDSARRFADLGADVFFGEGRFVDAETVAVGEKRLRFRHAVIATGASPAVPPIPGLAEAGYLTNETVWSLTERPARLAVIGGGPIGCELAQAFQRLGSRVALFEQGAQLMPKEDGDIAQRVHTALERDGVLVQTGSALQRVEPGKRVVYTQNGTEYVYDADAILVAAGRRPNVEGLGLDAAGVASTEKGVTVDDYLRTTNRRIFAAGDVASSYQFTHAADFAARTVIRNSLFGWLPGHARASKLLIPWVTYTDPEVAHVGLNERIAAERGVAIDTYTLSLEEHDRAMIDGATHGVLKLHTRQGSGRIVGGTYVAAHAGESIGVLTHAVQYGRTIGQLGKVIQPYPTTAELFRYMGDEASRRTLTPRLTALLRRFFAWQR